MPATIEYLETRGVPVVTIGQDEVPGFYARTSGVRTPWRVEDPAAAARLARDHLELGLGSGMLVCVPVPEDAALSRTKRPALPIDQAIMDADAAGIGGTGPDAVAPRPGRRADRAERRSGPTPR